MFIDAPW